MAEIGHNNPPDFTVTALETMRDISAWLSENPVIQTAESAKEAKLFLDRGKLALKDMDDERDGKVRPLNESVKKINEYYKVPRVQLETVLARVSGGITAYIRTEEQKRIEEAREAARIAIEAERKARAAETAEQDAIGSANSGELGIDIASHVVEADNAFREFEVAQRAAQRAEAATHVKISGGFSRSISLRQKETLAVHDAGMALRAIGLTEDISEAIIKSARAYRKLNGKLPDGVEATIREEV